MKGVEAPPIGGLIRAIVIVLVVLFAGWLLLAWAVLKRPVLAGLRLTQRHRSGV